MDRQVISANDAPPIVQLVLTIQFEPAAEQLSVFDVADLRGLFPEYMLASEVNRAGSMYVTGHDADTYQENVGGLPRIQLMDIDLQWSIIYQEDRLSVAWHRITGLSDRADYPGFSPVLDRLVRSYARLERYLSDRGIPRIVPKRGEVAYSDAFRAIARGDKAFRLEDTFNNVRSIAEFAFSTYNLTYTLVVQGDLDAHIDTNIFGPATSPDGQLVALMGTTVRFLIPNQSETESVFDKAHRRAQEVFTALVKPEACNVEKSL